MFHLLMAQKLDSAFGFRRMTLTENSVCKIEHMVGTKGRYFLSVEDRSGNEILRCEITPKECNEIICFMENGRTIQQIRREQRLAQ